MKFHWSNLALYELQILSKIYARGASTWHFFLASGCRAICIPGKWTKIPYSYFWYAFPLVHAVTGISAPHSWQKVREERSIGCHSSPVKVLVVLRISIYVPNQSSRQQDQFWSFECECLALCCSWNLGTEVLRACNPPPPPSRRCSLTLVLAPTCHITGALFWQGVKSHHVCFHLLLKRPCRANLLRHSLSDCFAEQSLGEWWPFFFYIYITWEFFSGFVGIPVEIVVFTGLALG